jgi:hypothetical protein
MGAKITRSAKIGNVSGEVPESALQGTVREKISEEIWK